MIKRTKAIWDEHTRLLWDMELIRTVADEVGYTPFDHVIKNIDRVVTFLSEHVMPHARAEEPTIYAAAQKTTGPHAIDMMKRDHWQIAVLADELSALRHHLVEFTPGDVQAKALRRVLYSLYATIKLHLAKEEEILLPVLERMSEDEATRIIDLMSAEEARATPTSR